METIYGKYIRTYDSLEKLKIKTKMDDIDFEWFGKAYLETMIKID